MPFTTPENREKMLKWLETGILPEKIDVGDWCFVYYREMMIEWKKNPCWTTAHNVYKKMLQDIRGGWWGNWWGDDLEKSVAYRLAWQVFFQLHVMHYELKKRDENGEVEV